MWKIYDDLIAAVPESSTVSACMAGLHWFLVRSESVGLAMAPREYSGTPSRAGRIAGMKTRDLARWVKSRNPWEAAFGLAAINSALNAPWIVERSCNISLQRMPNEDVFTYLFEELRGKRVAVIGHFPNLERLAEICELSILERHPAAGDFPDPACEYILPAQDVVISTATTLMNKTLPRLLQLCHNARVVIAGPSTPLTPLLFNYGIDQLGGLVVEDQELLWEVVQEGGQRNIFDHGTRMVKVARVITGNCAKV
jgi:uncharacterized protein (DUF4213/DUF364 family)